MAVAVGDSLRRAGIRAVLTGGACACVHSHGAHSSFDVDLVLAEPCEADALERALRNRLGYSRIRAWSDEEGDLDRHQESLAELTRRRRSRASR